MDKQELLERALLLCEMLQAATQEGRHAFTIDKDFVQQLSNDLFETLTEE